MTIFDVSYTGAPALAGLLVQLLEEGGAEVEWEPPLEERGGRGPGMGELVVIGLVVKFASDAGEAVLKAAVDRLRKRFPRTKVEVKKRYD